MSRVFPTAILHLYVDTQNQELVELYKAHIAKHNDAIKHDSHPNAGFDLFVPENFTFESQFATHYINMRVKGEMTFNKHPSAFTLHPRSSISKTPLMLANSTGIIDSGYRGDLIGAFRSFQSSAYTVDKHTRLLQICHPMLYPIHVELVETESELSSTSRGGGGFGSTGVVGVAK